MSETMESLCFEELYDAKRDGKIELAEYLEGIVAHYRGVRHDADADAEEQRPWIPRGFESEVRDTVLDKGFKPLGDEGKYHAVSYTKQAETHIALDLNTILTTPHMLL